MILRPSKNLYCGLLGYPDPRTGATPKTFLYCFGFTVPMVAILVTYTMIYCKVRKHSQQFKNSKNQQKNYRFFKVVMVIFVVFLVCYVPVRIDCEIKGNMVRGLISEFVSARISS